MSQQKDAVLFDLADSSAAQKAPNVADAPPVPDPVGATADGMMPATSMVQAAEFAARRPSRLLRWFLASLGALITAMVSIAAWDFVTGLLTRFPLLGLAVTAGFAVATILALALCLRELAAVARLRRVDSLQKAQPKIADIDDPGDALVAAQAYLADLERFYRGRKDVAWGLSRLAERKAEVLDADALLQLAEAELLAPLDARALSVVETGARQVATVTALVPLALADVVAALVTSVRMIRQIAEIYGGRSGALSSWRLTRAVLSHLVATGAVAVGDDLLEPVLGGSVLSKISRRFGEGLVNGALSARVGIAAMEVCRPMAFGSKRKPSTRGVIQRALTGLFTSAKT
ncbi:YcjF family protein [Phaeobacter sp.]|uniref:YcjF family protein n=1 Tax=Phaeobacter sp. TaxID=1902409 RepID=UPI0025E43BD6|nr:TIGR01620 family protein [Phaeobacter sp.]